MSNDNEGTAMSERSYTTVDKAGWGDGPWNDEPDKLQWLDEATGLDCLIVRGPAGALCGYVGVPAEHPWHGRGYGGDGWDDSSAPDNVIEVHGGLTYSEGCQEGEDESVGVCHVPAPGRPDDVWWFGFDCAHSQDLSPAFEMRNRALYEPGGPLEGRPDLPDLLPKGYRTLAYVRGQVSSLARQLVAVVDGAAG